jgi:flagellar biosynthesis protein FliR
LLAFSILQLEHWLGLALWPFLRIAGCLMVAPVFGASYVPARIKILLAGTATLAALPQLPPLPQIAFLSGDGVLITMQQVIIGVALGFILQLVFDTLTLAGQLLANGMGLGFAFNIDPLRGVSTPAMGQFCVVLGTLVFLSLNGHLAFLELTIDSFRGLPIGTAGFEPQQYLALANLGSQMFAGALRIALPGITALLVINMAFGVASRAAPSLNLFAVGFPVTLIFGLFIVLFGLPTVGSGVVDLLSSQFAFMRQLVHGG